MDYKFATQILIVSLYVPTIVAIYCFFLWRPLVRARWKKVAFTVVPGLLSAFVVIRIMAQFGLLTDPVTGEPYSPLLVFVISVLYVVNTYLMIFLFVLATKAVRRAVPTVPNRDRGALSTPEILSEIRETAAMMQGFFENFLNNSNAKL